GLEQLIRDRLGDVRLVTDDFRAMLARAQEAAAELDGLARSGAGAGADASAAADFLHWLVDGSFVFLGYREYQVMTLGGTRVLLVRSGSGLGLLRRESRSAFSRPRPLAELPEVVRVRLLGDRLLTITKTIAESPVHRRARMDDVGIRQLDATGHVTGAPAVPASAITSCCSRTERSSPSPSPATTRAPPGRSWQTCGRPCATSSGAGGSGSRTSCARGTAPPRRHGSPRGTAPPSPTSIGRRRRRRAPRSTSRSSRPRSARARCASRSATTARFPTRARFAST